MKTNYMWQSILSAILATSGSQYAKRKIKLDNRILKFDSPFPPLSSQYGRFFLKGWG